MSTTGVVLDASAVLAWVLKARGYATVDKVLSVAVIPASVLTEVLYKAPELGHAMAPSELHAALLGSGIVVEPITEADSLRAAELIAASRAARSSAVGTLSLGDGLCLAVAERLQLPVSGGDQVWETLDLKVRYFSFR